MSRKEIITVTGLSKAYALYERPIDMLKEAITGRKIHDTFWALRDVNFRMHEKERIGIIGANGSGKSTLLKIITGHLPATHGTFEVRGKISAMLSLNTVLNPEETGLANIRFNLLLNGCPKAEIEAKAEEIIEFTELGPFIYAPVKTYSSGMNAKLAFAITTSIEPDVLVIDEVLSVGDAYFMGKATNRMKELCERGNGLLFVSHSTSSVQMLCDKVLWMENGSVRMFGECDQVIRAYEEDYRRQEDEVTRAGNARRAHEQSRTAALQDVGSATEMRVRLVGANAKSVLTDTHYVSAVSVVGTDGYTIQIPLQLPQSVHDEGSRLDVMSSEWGRLYEHNGRECRALSPRTGKRKGGHLVLPAPQVAGDVLVEVLSCSRSGHEDLALETVDLEAGSWQKADLFSSRTEDGWRRSVYKFHAKVVDARTLEEAISRVSAMQRPSVSIRSVDLLADGIKCTVVSERQPFAIDVELEVNEDVLDLDVGIKLTRADGVYVFWQSSGLVGQHVRATRGTLTVDFRFDENNLGAGDYALTAYAANGWDFPANYPYSEVFDRKVACVQFKVLPAVPGLDMGLLNQRVEVDVRRGDAEGTHVPPVAAVAR